MSHILIIDDDVELARMLQTPLVNQGYKVTAVDKLSKVKAVFYGSLPVDLILLDVNLPDGDGVNYCHKLSSEMENCPPIILMTAAPNQAGEIMGLDFGAEDYISKPLDIMTLLARVRRALKRKESNHKSKVGTKYRFEGWVLDTLKRELISPDELQIELTSSQYNVLLVMLENVNKVMTREDIFSFTNRNGYMTSDRVVDAQISRLRKIFKNHPKLIKTVRNNGYVFSADVEEL